MGAAAAVPLTSFQGNLLHQLSNNYVFVVGFWAWFAAQFCKVGPVVGHIMYETCS
jgi:hypothetical protein